MESSTQLLAPRPCHKKVIRATRILKHARIHSFVCLDHRTAEMVFAIRRLLLRSKIPNSTLRLSTQLPLRHTYPPNQLLRTPSCLQQRQFSVPSRLYRDEKDKAGLKDEEAFGKELESRSKKLGKSEDVEALKKEEDVLEEPLKKDDGVVAPEKDSAVFENVELPVKDEAVVEPPTNLPTSEDPVATKEKAAVFEDVKTPTKDEPVSAPPTNLPTKEDPIAEKEEAAVFEDVELPSEKETAPEPATNEDTNGAKDEPALVEDADLPAKEEAVLEPPINLSTNEDPVPTPEEPPKEELQLFSGIEPSKKGEIMAPTLGKDFLSDDILKEHFDLSPEGFVELKAWQKEIGLSDEKLGYFINTYPGIDAPLIEAVHKGIVPEEDVLTILEDALAEEESELSHQDQKKLKRVMRSFEDLDESTFDDNPGFTAPEIKQLGLRQSDIDALKDDNVDALTPGQTYRIGQALRKLGLTKEELNDVLDMEEGMAEEKEYNKQIGLDHLPEPELPVSEPQIDVYTKVMEEIEEMQNRTGISEDRIMYYISKFEGQATADLIQAAERGRVTESRLEYYIEKYSGTYPFPVDSELILAIDKGEFEEEALIHVVQSIPSPPPNIVKAVLKGELSVDEVNELREKYDVPTHVIGSVYSKDITEEQLSKFVNDYPGVEPDVQLINDVEKGVYNEDDLNNLKRFGEMYPTIMSAEYWRGVLAGEFTQEQLDKAEKAAEHDPWDIPAEALEEWQQEYGISDQMLNFLRETYPGIWPDLITSFALGEIKELDIPKIINSDEPWQMPKGMIDRWLKDQNVSEAKMLELRRKFPKIWPSLLADVAHGEIEEADVEQIIAEDEAEKAENATPWDEEGITEDNIGEWMQANSVTQEMFEYLMKTYPEITPDIMADFAEGVIEQKQIPTAIRRYQKQRGKEVTEEKREAKEELKELEIPSQVEGKTMAERVQWYQDRYPGIDMETITMAEMGVINEADIPNIMREGLDEDNDQEDLMSQLLEMSPEELREAGNKLKMSAGVLPQQEDDAVDEETESAMVARARSIKNGPLTKLHPRNGGTLEDLENLGPDEWYQMLMAEGLDPEKMSEKEIFKLMDEKFGMKDFEETDEDGNSLRYFTPKTKEELAKIQAGLGNTLEPIGFDQPGMGEREWAEELEDQDENLAEEEAEIEKGLDEMFGLLSKDEIQEARKDRVEEGFFNYGEENPKEVGEDEEFQGDDISSQGHEELEQHRELREYARLAAWELPLLHSMLAYHFLRQSLLMMIQNSPNHSSHQRRTNLSASDTQPTLAHNIQRTRKSLWSLHRLTFQI
jgi:hypothetical protein